MVCTSNRPFKKPWVKMCFTILGTPSTFWGLIHWQWVDGESWLLDQSVKVYLDVNPSRLPKKDAKNFARIKLRSQTRLKVKNSYSESCHQNPTSETSKRNKSWVLGNISNVLPRKSVAEPDFIWFPGCCEPPPNQFIIYSSFNREDGHPLLAHLD